MSMAVCFFFFYVFSLLSVYYHFKQHKRQFLSVPVICLVSGMEPQTDKYSKRLPPKSEISLYAPINVIVG